MAHGDAREGKWRGNWRMEWVASTLTRPRNVMYPALLTLMGTPRLPAVDWTDSPADLNGLVLLGERRNVVSARVSSGSARALLQRPCSAGHTTCVPRFRNSVICVPKCVFHVYQLRPKSPIACVCVASIARGEGYAKFPTIWRFSYSFVVRYIILNYMHTNKTVEWRDNKPCYVMVLSRRTENHFFKEGNRHVMFLMTSVSRYGHVLKKIIFRRILMNKSRSSRYLTAKGRPHNSYPFLPNRLWCLINIFMFYFQTLLNFFDKYVWCLTTHICVNSCFRSRNERRNPKYQDEQNKFVVKIRVPWVQTLNLILIS